MVLEITEHRESIFNFVRKKHPEYKENSMMFKRKYNHYEKEVDFYKETFIDFKTKSTEEILKRLYPPVIRNKSRIVIFD